MGTILLMGAGLQTTVTGPTYDPDAQAFFNAETAAGVTLTTTQKDAVNQWVVDAKAAGIWSKFKAVYPMVGGTATAHKFNLKNPADTNAAFRLQFFGGGTHSANGYLPNGSNAYANTFCASNNMALNSVHLSYYSRTNTTSNGGREIAAASSVTSILSVKLVTLGSQLQLNQNTPTSYIAVADSRGFFIGSRTASNVTKLIRNGVVLANQNNSSVSTLSIPFYLCANNNNGNAGEYSIIECAFATIGDGLTDLESQLFYQITEKYQVALGRNVNATQSFYYNSAYNNETNAFLFSTQITDATIQTATNTLVSDLKTAGVFTKMKAVYPMVGGTATTHKFNLVNAQDTDAAFRLNFVGGWTHSANGALPNGTNAYANTFLSTSANLSLNSGHYSTYLRTNNTTVAIDIGSHTNVGSYTYLFTYYTPPALRDYRYCEGSSGVTRLLSPARTDGHFITSRTGASAIKGYRNGAVEVSATTASDITSNIQIIIGALNNNGTAQNFSNRQCAFASIGDGLSDAEALSLYNAVQTFQTTLVRQV